MGILNPKANALFLQAIELPSSDRRAGFLDEACAGDPTLRAEVEQLLKAHESSGSYREQPLFDEQRTQDFAAATDRDNPPAASCPARAAVSLDFLEPCDIPGRLGKIGPYEVIGVIGAGGMGVVLRAYEPKLNRIVAVKVMAPRLVVNPTARKRFLREAQASAAVTHPHVVAIHAVEQTERMSYLVMECIIGPSLEEKIDRCGHLELKEIVRIGAQVAAGLAAAHAQGLVHRDIKPSNILLENGIERVRITDFGIARAVDDVGLTCTGEVAGTPQFMSPEQAEGNPVDHRSDLFSLGAVLYTMCTGRSPFRAEGTVAVLRRVCDDVPRPIREVNPDIPVELVAIIDRLLAKAPEQRFQTAQEVADLLLICLTRLQEPASAASPEPWNVPAASNRRTRAAGAALGGRRPRRTMLLAAIVLLGLFVSVAVTEGTGVTHLTAAILRIGTGAGTLVVEVDDPQVSVTIDGEDLVITGTGPKEVRLKPGHYRVEASKGSQILKQELVTIERGGRQVLRVALEPPATPPAVMTSSIAAHGLGGLDKIIPTTFPQSWRSDRDFAKISSVGEMVFPTIPACRYVFETELTIGNPQNGRIIYRIAGGGNGTDLSLGSLWSQDRTATTVPCRLFNTTATGLLCWDGEEHFAIAQRLALKLIVADQERVLFCNGKRALGVNATPVDFTLKIVAEGTPVCTIHTCSLRPLDASDIQAIGREVRPYDLKLDPEKTARRIGEQTGGLPTVAETGKPLVVKSIDAALRWIPAGDFTMGPEANGKGKHHVMLSQGFWMGQYTVTQGQWLRLISTNPSRFRGSPYLPVHWLSWEDAMRFCEDLDSRERKAGRLPAGYQYRLPTEAEWEYACKAGSGENQPKKPPEGWWRANAGGCLHEVGELPPNRWGLYDMHGNAGQWCLDVWQDYPPESATAMEDPCRLWQSNDDRLCLRGGDWWRWDPDDVRPISRDSSRSAAAGYYGFRIVLARTFTAIDNVPETVAAAEEPSPTAASPAAQSAVHLPVGGSLIGPDGKWKLPSGAPLPAIAPFDAQEAKEHQARWAKHLGMPVEIVNSIGMKLVLVPPGEFMMGSPKELIDEELKAHGDDRFYKDHLPGEGPQHRVRITRPFYLGAFAVTQEEYQRVTGKNPSEFSATGDGKSKIEGQETKRFPVEQVSWHDAAEFCRKLSHLPQEQTAGRTYGLPSEAEWEYACRAGSTGRFSFSLGRSGIPKEYEEQGLSDYGWFSSNSGGRTHAVGGKKPNAWGLYDMHGNVWQWCRDWYDKDYYANSPTDDPIGPLGGLTRVFRGGSQELSARYCRSARRIIFEPGWRLGVMGMRISLVLADK